MTAGTAASRTAGPGAILLREEEPMLVEVTCRCGWTCRGTEDDVIALVQAHGRETHGIETTADEVRAIWRRIPEDAASS